MRRFDIALVALFCLIGGAIGFGPNGLFVANTANATVPTEQIKFNPRINQIDFVLDLAKNNLAVTGLQDENCPATINVEVIPAAVVNNPIKIDLSLTDKFFILRAQFIINIIKIDYNFIFIRKAL